MSPLTGQIWWKEERKADLYSGRDYISSAPPLSSQRVFRRGIQLAEKQTEIPLQLGEYH